MHNHGSLKRYAVYLYSPSLDAVRCVKVAAHSSTDLNHASARTGDEYIDYVVAI